jgi:hypothetical protein
MISTDQTLSKLVQVARDMLENRINLIEGCKKICALRHELSDPENDIFLPIRAIDSETDHFPLGTVRDGCAENYLRRVDEEMLHYLEDARDDIRAACREIIRALG